jgi:short-subunit dehydrogenase
MADCGGEAIHVPADVGSPDDVEAIAQMALKRFGHFDTWVNNAGAGVYGRIEEVPIDDLRRVMETNFWGVVYGSRVAVRHLKERGGAIINIGSVLSDRAVPLQGIYTASKHAVKGFTDSLRMEVEEAGYPISVTLVKPTSIDTPFFDHAKNYMANAPKGPPPVYAPETAAKAILHAATHRDRDLFVGGASRLISLAEQVAPRLTDRYMEAVMFKQQQRTDKPARRRDEALHHHDHGLSERGDYEAIGHVVKTSPYTEAQLHPWITTAILGAAGIAGMAVAAILTSPPKRLGRVGRHLW